MALTANDVVIFIPPTGPFQPFPPRKGWVIVVGANPEIIWEDSAGTRAVYTGIAAPAGVIRTAPAPIGDIATWMNQLVQPPVGVGPFNSNGRARGVVKEVFLSGDPPTFLSVLVKTLDGLWYVTSATAGVLEIVT